MLTFATASLNVTVHGVGGDNLFLQVATLLVAAVAVLASLQAVRLSARLAKQSEDSSWLRDQQLKCYAAFRKEAVAIAESLGAFREWWFDGKGAADATLRAAVLEKFDVHTHFKKLRQAQNQTLIFGRAAVRDAQQEVEKLASWSQIIILWPPQGDVPKAISTLWDNNQKLNKAIEQYIVHVRESFDVFS